MECWWGWGDWLSQRRGNWLSRYWELVVKAVEDLVITVLVVLVIVFDGEEKKRKAYLLRCRACSHGYISTGQWGGPVIDVGTELGGGDRRRR